MIFTSSDKETTLIYNSNNHIGQQILAFAQHEKIPIHDNVKYKTRRVAVCSSFLSVF